MIFAAIDFETANRSPSSACAVGIVRVDSSIAVAHLRALIRPPTRSFRFASMHGITRDMLVGSPTFVELWPRIETILRGTAFIAAHNAGFDRRVLRTCLERGGRSLRYTRFICSADVARSTWGLRSARLTTVCAHLGIPLRTRHDPLADASACARIILAAVDEGWQPPW